jgi:hypothetical protein
MLDPTNNGKGGPKIPASTRTKALDSVAMPAPAPAFASNLKPLLKNPEAAAILGVTPGCLEKARSEKRGLGLIPTVDFGPGVRMTRYDPDVLAAHIKKQKGGK